MKEFRIFQLSPNGVTEGRDFVEQSLKEKKIKSSKITEAMLLTEEIVCGMLTSAEGTKCETYRIAVISSFGKTTVRISSDCGSFSIFENTGLGMTEASLYDDSQTQAAIRGLLLNHYRDTLRAKNRRGTCTANLCVSSTENRTVILSLIALFSALLFGTIATLFLPETFCLWISSYLFQPIRTIFLRLLGVILGPVVFFSIASCVSQFSDLSSLGRMGLKTFFAYCITSLIACFIGLASAKIFIKGDFGYLLSSSVTPVDAAPLSLIDMIVDIFPSNFFGAFVDSKVLQLLFLGMLCGITVTRLGESFEKVRDFLDVANELFLKMTELITRFIPLIIFAAGSDILISIGDESFETSLNLIVIIVFADLLMLCVYFCGIAIFAKLNPFIFFKKYLPTALLVFSLSSSNASMPMNLKFATEKAGVSSKLASFSIPFGATVNMDALALCLVSTLFTMAHAFGVALTAYQTALLFILVILLTMGVPGIPGGSLLIAAFLFAQFGLPEEAFSIFIAVASLLDMFLTTSNTAGDQVCSIIVAKTENLLDKDIYNAK